MTCSIAHDFVAFAGIEMESRKSPLYPPYCRLVNIVVSGLDEGATQEGAQRAADWLAGLIRRQGISDVEIVGPAPAPIERIRDRWRWHVLLRATRPARLGQVCRYFAERFRIGGSGDLRLAIDRDPVALL